jgi:hypothetical protein
MKEVPTHARLDGGIRKDNGQLYSLIYRQQINRQAQLYDIAPFRRRLCVDCGYWEKGEACNVFELESEAAAENMQSASCGEGRRG